VYRNPHLMERPRRSFLSARANTQEAPPCRCVPFSGTIDPEMGTAAILSDILFGHTRGALLAVLYGHIGESFYLRQLARRTDITLGAVQRELRQLVDAGLVTRRVVGSQTFYSANQASPIFEEMRSLVTKTVGIHDVLLEALRPLHKKINLAFVYGSTARSKEDSESDVDLMIVGRVPFADVIEHLADAQKTLDREINPTVYSTREFRSKVEGNFLRTVLAGKKLFLIGDESELRELGKE
jgi:predicted nucleotidyltransferase